MSGFTTRVELHYATSDDYTNLHAQMAMQGFKRTVKGDDGIVYQLPTAEYRYDGYATKWQVLEKARAAATVIGRGYEIFMTEGDNMCWVGLTPISMAA